MPLLRMPKQLDLFDQPLLCTHQKQLYHSSWLERYPLRVAHSIKLGRENQKASDLEQRDLDVE